MFLSEYSGLASNWDSQRRKVADEKGDEGDRGYSYKVIEVSFRRWLLCPTWIIAEQVKSGHASMCRGAVE